MKDLYIVFGSETKLLKELFEREGVFFIRIYNNRVPSPLENAIDVNSVDAFKVEFEKYFESKNRRGLFSLERLLLSRISF